MSKLRVGGVPRSHCKLKQRWNKNPGLLTHDQCPTPLFPPPFVHQVLFTLVPCFQRPVSWPQQVRFLTLSSVCGGRQTLASSFLEKKWGVKQTLMTSSDLCPRPHTPRCPPVTWPQLCLALQLRLFKAKLGTRLEIGSGKWRHFWRRRA